jgi:hypothetical protein
MKQDEEPAAIQHDFLEYRKLLERVFSRRRTLKAAWTPDGVMACFPSVDDAVHAGKDIIRDLVSFNRQVKAKNGGQNACLHYGLQSAISLPSKTYWKQGQNDQNS